MNPYEKILSKLESLQDELTDIKNYDEGAYQAIQNAINYLEYELSDEEEVAK